MSPISSVLANRYSTRDKAGQLADWPALRPGAAHHQARVRLTDPPEPPLVLTTSRPRVERVTSLISSRSVPRPGFCARRFAEPVTGGTIYVDGGPNIRAKYPMVRPRRAVRSTEPERRQPPSQPLLHEAWVFPRGGRAPRSSRRPARPLRFGAATWPPLLAGAGSPGRRCCYRSGHCPPRTASRDVTLSNRRRCRSAWLNSAAKKVWTRSQATAGATVRPPMQITFM